ncbi:hypothetical protein FB45DRAFT_1009754 [Roridomyces roridus]|uniref:Uncharacterized protein n=1 Tax=Roridomyces roridus TaxID=1738132 RepID=A0AAD7FCF1_9AGAR|nr:hypothetical protein FB45DRAFT_1009754 [Roridomyces roridus]
MSLCLIAQKTTSQNFVTVILPQLSHFQFVNWVMWYGWRSSNPIEATDTPEKYKELKGRGEAVEGVHQWLWKTVVEFDCILVLSDSNEGSLFYNSWYRTPGDNETLRAVCYRNTDLLTREGVHHVLRLLERDAEAPIDNPPFVFHALEEARVKPRSPGPVTSGKSPSHSASNASNYHLVDKPPLSTDVFRRPRTVKCGGVRGWAVRRAPDEKQDLKGVFWMRAEERRCVSYLASGRLGFQESQTFPSLHHWSRPYRAGCRVRAVRHTNVVQSSHGNGGEREVAMLGSQTRCVNFGTPCTPKWTGSEEVVHAGVQRWPGHSLPF